jgi:hypothetical protein
VCLVSPAFAGPPYVTDDPEPTDYRHYEVYGFTSGTGTRDDTSTTTGIDFNYGGAEDLQLTAVLPLVYDAPAAGADTIGIGNIELAAKFKFLHQDDVGVDVAFFPRVFLPTISAQAGEHHVSLLLPLYVGRTWGDWSTFGGGGCTLNRGGDSQDFCQAGWVITRQLTPKLNMGVEVYHQGADTKGGKVSTGVGVGAVYDLDENYHLMASFGPGIQNAAETNRYTWYAALLFTL